MGQFTKRGFDIFFTCVLRYTEDVIVILHRSIIVRSCKKQNRSTSGEFLEAFDTSLANNYIVPGVIALVSCEDL